jgi:hypothetical protein
MAEPVAMNLTTAEGGLDGIEIRYWRNNYEWLRDRGYQLRPRYSPDWIPSWIGTTKPHWNFEDGVNLVVRSLNLSLHRFSFEVPP